MARTFASPRHDALAALLAEKRRAAGYGRSTSPNGSNAVRTTSATWKAGKKS